MSDWEEEYDEDGVAIQKTHFKSAQTDYKLPFDDRQRENVFFGARNGTRFGASRETEYKSRRGGGEGRPLTWSTGRRIFGGENSDFSPPVTITVENVSIGRIIGRLLKQ